MADAKPPFSDKEQDLYNQIVANCLGNAPLNGNDDDLAEQASTRALAAVAQRRKDLVNR